MQEKLEEEMKGKENDNTVNNDISLGLNQLGLDLISKIPEFSENHGPPGVGSSFFLSLTPPSSDFSLSTTSSLYAPILTYDIIRYGPELPSLEGLTLNK
jgi:hypothetical protein